MSNVQHTREGMFVDGVLYESDAEKVVEEAAPAASEAPVEEPVVEAPVEEQPAESVLLKLEDEAKDLEHKIEEVVHE